MIPSSIIEVRVGINRKHSPALHEIILIKPPLLIPNPLLPHPPLPVQLLPRALPFRLLLPPLPLHSLLLLPLLLQFLVCDLALRREVRVAGFA